MFRTTIWDIGIIGHNFKTGWYFFSFCQLCLYDAMRTSSFLHMECVCVGGCAHAHVRKWGGVHFSPPLSLTGFYLFF